MSETKNNYYRLCADMEKDTAYVLITMPFQVKDYIAELEEQNKMMIHALEKVLDRHKIYSNFADEEARIIQILESVTDKEAKG